MQEPHMTFLLRYYGHCLMHDSILEITKNKTQWMCSDLAELFFRNTTSFVLSILHNFKNANFYENYSRFLHLSLSNHGQSGSINTKIPLDD